MLSGDFERKLTKLNRNLRIYCGNDSSKPAGIFTVLPNGDYQEICGVDKNYLPEHIVYNDKGFIIRSGWRRPLKILINKGYIDRHKAEKVFETYLEYSAPKPKRKQSSVASVTAKHGIGVVEEK